MPTKQLIRTMIIVHFSKPSIAPYKNAVTRIVIGLSCALAFGWLLSESLRNANLPVGLPEQVITTVMLAIGFVLGGFIVMALNASLEISTKSNNHGRILKLMPISRFTSWFALTLPMLIILVIVGMFGGMVIFRLCSVLKVSSVQPLVYFLAGLYSGYGCLLLKKPSRTYQKALLFIILIFIVGLLFDKLLNSGLDSSRNIILDTINVLLIFPLFGHVNFYMSCRSINTTIQKQNLVALIPNKVSYQNWFVVKLLRNKRTKGSFLIAMALSMSASLVIQLRNTAQGNNYQFLFLGAVLAATFACDVRGVFRRLQPPEIVLLNGVKGIVRSEMFAVLVCGFIIGLPLLFVFMPQTAIVNYLLFYFAIQSFSSIIGLFASTVFVPTSNDTGSQFMSAMLAISSIVFLPRLIGFSDVDYPEQKFYWLATSLAIVIFINVIELIRRRKYGYS